VRDRSARIDGIRIRVCNVCTDECVNSSIDHNDRLGTTIAPDLADDVWPSIVCTIDLDLGVRPSIRGRIARLEILLEHQPIEPGAPKRENRDQ